MSERRLLDAHKRYVDATSEAEQWELTAEALSHAGLTPLAGGAAPRLDRVYQAVQRLGGFIPGRHPVRRQQLVVLRATRGDPAVPVLIEAARVIVARSRTDNAPDRTVLVLVTEPGADTRRAAGIVWPSEAIVAQREVRAQPEDEPEVLAVEVSATSVARLIQQVQTLASQPDSTLLDVDP